MSQKHVKIIHEESGTLIAEGPLGWAITPFEGNYYISRKYLSGGSFRTNYMPGVCIYKFFYVWLDFIAPNGSKTKFLGWKYVLPNPLLPFIWFRVAVPKYHPDLSVEEYSSSD